ncbi:MAG: nitronate monooxygenase [Flavobacteriales bacterium]|nr:nitronate monooxygenase [Flavobacteriales bacterium]
MKNRITELFKIDLPIIQAGMIWCSGWELASAVSNAGGLGIIGAGSMYPDVLRSQISKCKKATNKPFAVNLPLLYPSIEEHVQTIIDLKVPIVFTSAGSPSKWTPLFKQHGITVVHVVSNVKFAQKSESSGVDAIVAEGFEAGGHNGREETTTICLIPLLLNNVKIPIIAAGGIGSGSAMAAAFALGAEAVQIGSLFVATSESSAHQNFKNLIVDAIDGSTELSLKELTPVRLLKNKFYDDIQTAYNNKASILQLKELLGRGRAKKGMFEGDLIEGELEIGQIASSITQVKPAARIVNEIWIDFKASIKKLGSLTD